jgi:hypothetical protein
MTEQDGNFNKGCRNAFIFSACFWMLIYTLLKMRSLFGWSFCIFIFYLSSEILILAAPL